VEVPLHRISLAEMRELHCKNADKDGESAIQTQGLKILIVDDSATSRKLMNRTLSRKGNECTEAEDGQVSLSQMSSRDIF
jgi:PleD family two-component response regulator